MCNPALAIPAAQAGLQFIQAKTSIDSQNAAAHANADAARVAQNDSIAQSTQGYIEQNRSLIQGSFDAVLKGRRDESLAYTSAIQNGVDGASVKALLKSAKQNTGRTVTRANQEQASLAAQQGVNVQHIGSKTQARINSNTGTKWNWGDTAQVLAPIVKSQLD